MLSRSIHRYAQQLSYTSGYLVMSHSHVSKSPTDTVLLGMNTTPYITAAFFLLVLTTYYDKSCGLSPLSKFTEDPLTFSSFDLAPFLIDTVLLARLTTWHSFNPHDFLSHLGPTVCIRAARLITSHAFYVVLHNSLTQKIDAHTSLIQTLIFIDSTLQLLDWTYMSSKLLASLQTDINQYRWEIQPTIAWVCKFGPRILLYHTGLPMCTFMHIHYTVAPGSWISFHLTVLYLNLAVIGFAYAYFDCQALTLYTPSGTSVSDG